MNFCFGEGGDVRSAPSYLCYRAFLYFLSPLPFFFSFFFSLSPFHAAIRGVGVISRDVAMFVKRWCAHGGRGINCL